MGILSQTRIGSVILLVAVAWLPRLAFAEPPQPESSEAAAETTTDTEATHLSDLSPATKASESCCQQCGQAVSESCPCCQASAKPDPCATSHKGVFYANDFSYLNDCDYDGCCFGDRLKLMSVGPCGEWGTLDVGGQIRLRYHREIGMGQNPGRTRFQNTSNDFMLTRLRLYTNWKINEVLRFYAEGIYADVTAPSDYIPRPFDENYGDLLNAFVDVQVTDDVAVRVGRQELLYGSQRVVSPLDWANTRRTFEGVNVMHRGGDWSTDAFYTNFVPVRPNQFDEADYDQSFYGVYSTFSGFEDATVDFYYLGYDNETAGVPVQTDFSLHTFGARINGKCGDWLYEVEGAPQFGRQSGLALDHSAGYVTGGIGREFNCMPWSPTVWCYYDYASGNNFGGDFNRYNQLFPLAHKFLGFIDAVQRSNIESPNMLVTMKPTEKTSLLLWYYHLMANQGADVVPAIGGTPAQNTSKHLGDELDLIWKYTINARSDVLFGWSHFWAGNRIAAPDRRDADFFYCEWAHNF